MYTHIYQHRWAPMYMYKDQRRTSSDFYSFLPRSIVTGPLTKTGALHFPARLARNQVTEVFLFLPP